MTERQFLRKKHNEFWKYLQARKAAKAEGRDFYEDRKTRTAKAQMAHKPYGGM